ncbi:DUF1254 domain-containing protein [Nitriliruptoraceae bacterium ZYF776]|nr:DUF1254 domain-containing protein [Profundirhabdus halotolerans]
MTRPRAPYDLHEVDQLRLAVGADMVPEAEHARTMLARSLAFDATVYGLAAVHQYAQMCPQVSGPTAVGFNVFDHQTELATPGFAPFRTPNVDTLYSNAWLDLTAGPVALHVPAMGARYYTLQFCDAHANATNLSSRTVGPDGGDFLVTLPGWSGVVPPGHEVFTVATPHVWILMRIAFDGTDAGLDEVRSLQSEVAVQAPPRSATVSPAVTLDSVEEHPEHFLAALDAVLRTNGTPWDEVALVRRYRPIGVGGPDPFDAARLDTATRIGIALGFREAMDVVRSSRSQFGEHTASGWMTGTVGENGFHYLRRAVQNFVGTGGNVREEKIFFVAFDDGDGVPLDGATANYLVTFAPQPPVHGHWSLTMYDVVTRGLVANTLERYAVGPWTPGVPGDGPVTIEIGARDGGRGDVFLPAPTSGFYVDLRLWQPAQTIRAGAWTPPAIRRVALVSDDKSS